MEPRCSCKIAEIWRRADQHLPSLNLLYLKKLVFIVNMHYNTCIAHRLNFLWYYFWRDRNKYHVTKTSQFFTIVLALNRILALIGIFFGNTLRYVYFGCLSSVVRRGISKYLWIFQKGYKLRMNWRLDLIQTNLLPFEGFRYVFINHSFCKWPL